MSGEWNGETYDFKEVVDRAMLCDPDILVTHAPPAGILDDRAHGGGISELTNYLSYREHSVKAHFFGHIHETGGRVVEKMGIKFINGAGRVLVHNI